MVHPLQQAEISRFWRRTLKIKSCWHKPS